MARNTNPWYKNFPELWLGSERVKLMSLAAEGLYRRCIDYQAQHGSIPTDLPKLSRLICKFQVEVEAAWPEVAEHFDGFETTENGEVRVYNTKLREILEETCKPKEAQRKAAEETNLKRKKNKANQESVSTGDGQRSGDRALRASSSSSLSKSSSLSFFNEFWEAYPSKKKKVKAEAAWLKTVQSAELAKAIIANVRERALYDRQWLEDEGKFIPHPSTYLNNQDWHDSYRRAALPPARVEDTEPVPSQLELPPLEPVPSTLWPDLLYSFSQEYPEAMEDWITPLHPLGISDGTLWVVAPSDFTKAWVAANYAADLSKLLSLELRLVTASQVESEANAMRDP